jgi:hypothetical protein
MVKVSWKVVSEQLDRFFLLPFAEGEDVNTRALAIESYLHISGWTWDSVLDSIWMEDKN